MRKIRAAVICLILITILAASCYASEPIGVGPVVEYSGDFDAEKRREDLFLGIALFPPDSPPVADLKELPEAKVVEWFQNSEVAYWKMYPMWRWSFTLADPENPGWLEFGRNLRNAMKSAIASLASVIMVMSAWTVNWAIILVVFVFNIDLLYILTAWIGEGIETIFYENPDVMYLILAVICILLIIYSTKKLLEGAAMSVLKAVLIAVCSVALTTLLIANAGDVFRKIAVITDVVTGRVLTAVGTHTYEGNYMRKSGVLPDDPLNRGLLIFSQTAWNAIIANPWGASLFGTINTENLTLTREEVEALKEHKNYFNNNDFSKVGYRVDLVYLGTTGEARYRLVSVLVNPRINHGEKGTMVGLWLDSAHWHLLISMGVFCAALAFIVLILRIGIPLLVSQIILVCLALISPLMAMAAAVPVKGMPIAKKYLKTFLYFLAIKVIYGFYLSIVIAIATAICSVLLEGGQVGLSLLLLIVIFLGATIFAGRFKNLFFEMLDSRSVSQGSVSQESVSQKSDGFPKSSVPRSIAKGAKGFTKEAALHKLEKDSREEKKRSRISRIKDYKSGKDLKRESSEKGSREEKERREEKKRSKISRIKDIVKKAAWLYLRRGR